ncbi:MAG: hypothetical protein ACHP7N_02365 [Caulobacterales bacterium]
MRRLALVLLLVLPTAVGAADVKSARPPAVAPPPKPTAPTAKPTPMPPARLSLVSSVRAAPPDPSECRIACAQSLYVCQGDDAASDCAPTWSRCVATCDLPNLDPGVSTAP